MYIMPAGAVNANQPSDELAAAKELLVHRIGVPNIKVVDVRTQFAKRQEIEAATFGKKRYPIIYLDNSLVGVRYL